MKWFLGILIFLTALIAAVLILPVSIIIKSGEGSKPLLLIKVLFFTFGGKSKPGKQKNQPKKEKAQKSEKSVSKSLKKLLGMNDDGSGEGDGGILFAVGQLVRIIRSVVEEVIGLIGKCVIKKLMINIVCSGDDAAETAVKYGRCCALVYPLSGFVCSVMKVRRRKLSINVGCDFSGAPEKLDYLAVISFRVFSVVAAAARILIKELVYRFKQKKISAESADKDNDSSEKERK